MDQLLYFVFGIKTQTKMIALIYFVMQTQFDLLFIQILIVNT